MKKLIKLIFIIFVAISCRKEVINEGVELPRVPINEEDSLVLVKINDAIKSLNWNFDDWDSNEELQFVYDEESQKKYVTSIVIISVLGESYIPKEIGKLSKLEYFLIYGDLSLGGTLPEEIFNCPLKGFKIVAPKLGGTLTSAVGKIANTATSFTITDTSMEGQLPEEFGDFKKLKQELDLSNNKFNGKLPKTFGSLPFGVNIAFNDLSSIDWEFFKIDVNKYKPVYMTHNKLEGIVPDEVLNSHLWRIFKIGIDPQKEGYGFDND